MPRPPFTRRYVPPARPDTATVLGLLRAHGADPARMDALAERWGAEAPAPRDNKQTTNRNRARGDAAEARCRRDLRAAGWHINSGRTGSYGAADIIAHRSERVAATDRPSVDTLMVQVKSTIAFKPSMLNAACRDYAQRVPRLAPSIALEVWAWLYGVGWVAVVRLDRDGGVTASGRYAQEVQRSITHTGAWPGL